MSRPCAAYIHESAWLYGDIELAEGASVWINAALRAFVNEMKSQGRWDDVTVLSASEFGRTITSNGRGTDHGWGGNHFVLGGSVNGGKIHGTYPDDLTTSSALNTGRGRIIPTTPWEGLWRPVGEWFGVDPEHEDAVLPNLRNFDADAHIIRTGDLFRMQPAPPTRRVLRPHRAHVESLRP